MALTYIRRVKTRDGAEAFDVSDVKKTYAFNCSELTASERMALTRQRFMCDGNDDAKVYHISQRFAKGETEPNLAHDLGRAMAFMLWSERFEIVLFTCENDGFCTNHFILNAVSFLDGKRYYDNKRTYAQLKWASDALCECCGLSVIGRRKA